VTLRLESLPVKTAAFVEPMECEPVSQLRQVSGWVYEILCGQPHKISSVAFAVMWRWRCGASRKRYGTSSYAT